MKQFGNENYTVVINEQEINVILENNDSLSINFVNMPNQENTYILSINPKAYTELAIDEYQKLLERYKEAEIAAIEIKNCLEQEYLLTII
ncbi:hypothetical protein N2C73_03810 [Enterococcus faecalis]|uniref:hypothetical protein n=1 Tax=Enterococcus faecalis TaxID=1351 RepID=UPI0021C6A817|nr:hypothetical protein [Enterococcus faecalis]MCU2249470.1 hypothetical protein [Enterococcus faecalis]